MVDHKHTRDRQERKQQNKNRQKSRHNTILLKRRIAYSNTMTTQSSQGGGANKTVSTFPIPSSLHDLERAPYNLLPYPDDFNDEDEATRADSFTGLVNLLEQGNRYLSSAGITLFNDSGIGDDDDDDLWMDEERVQALYTLVR